MTAPARKLAATQSSARTGTGKDNWCTPPEVLERVRKVGPITLDPCTSADNPVGAQVYLTEDDDGLTQPWESHELIYVNPPYSAAAEWAAKIDAEAGLFGCEIISLVAARPDSRWFYDLVWDSATSVCFWKGRLRFVGAPSSAPFPSAVVYHGARPWAFEAAFHDAGKVLRLR